MNGRRGSRPRRSHKAQLVPRRSIGVNIRGDLANVLRDYGDAIQEDVVRAGAWAGATVFYDAMREAAPVEDGELKDSIYRARSETQYRDGKAVYVIGPNKRKAPHWHLVEYGHWLVNTLYAGEDGKLTGSKRRRVAPKWVAAIPFIRSTFVGKVRTALNAMRTRMTQRLAEISKDMK